MDSTISIIVSSGAVAALVSFISVTLMIGKYREKVDTSEANIKTHTTKIDSLSEKVSKLEGGLERDRATTGYVKRKSPLSLTEKGKALLLDSKGNKYIDDNKQKLVDAVKSAAPKTAYDVQELSRSITESHSNDDSFSPIKEFAFKEGLDLKDILDVMGIYLRDIALPEFGFNISQIP